MQLQQKHLLGLPIQEIIVLKLLQTVETKSETNEDNNEFQIDIILFDPTTTTTTIRRGTLQQFSLQPHKPHQQPQLHLQQKILKNQAISCLCCCFLEFQQYLFYPFFFIVELRNHQKIKVEFMMTILGFIRGVIF